MYKWTAQDEINLQRWIQDRGFNIVYLLEVEQFGYTHKDNPKQITAGFNKLVDLKQHFVKLKGDSSNVQIVSEAELHQELERAGMLPVI